MTDPICFLLWDLPRQNHKKEEFYLVHLKKGQFRTAGGIIQNKILL